MTDERKTRTQKPDLLLFPSLSFVFIMEEVKEIQI